MITELDTQMLYCGGLIKIRAKKENIIDPYLLLGLLNSYIVKRLALRQLLSPSLKNRMF